MALEMIANSDVESEASEDAARPLDVGADTLPFSHLSGQRFETLSYLLRRAAARSGEAVTLVKASGDRGRDVVVHEGGRLTGIIQCKNERSPVTKPDVMRELLKITLHARRDPAVLPWDDGPPVGVSVWSASGFTEQAASLIDTWPSQWTEAAVLAIFPETIERYASLEGCAWSDVRELVVERLPKRVMLEKRDGHDLTLDVRRSVAIYQQFFRGQIVAPLDDVTRVVHAAVASAMTGADVRRITAEDMRHILARVESFPEDQRLFFGNGYVLGVRADLIADMSAELRGQLLESVVTPALATSRLFMQMVPERAYGLVEAARPRLHHRNRVFPLVVHQTLVTRALRQLGRVFTPTFLLPKMLERFGPDMRAADVFEVVDILARKQWDDYQRILAPDFRPPTTDPVTEKLRRDGAKHALAGYSDRASFESALLDDCRQNLAVIRELVDAIETYFPRDLMVVADAKSAFDDEDLLKKLMGTLDLIGPRRAGPE